MEEWDTRPLSDFVDTDRSICYGIVQPGSAVSNGIPIVRVNNFVGGGIETADALKVDSEIEAKYNRSRLQGGELLITLVGSMGLTAIAPKELRGWNVARAVGVVPLRADADKRWINFVIRGKSAQDFIRTRANTTVQATFNLKDLAELPITYPPDPARSAMSSMLSALDDKIELNRQMNESLETMARAIFKDWFVDFGPTRAKMESRAPYLAQDIWSAFPDHFDDEGRPKGWGVSSVYEIADVIYGAPFSSRLFNIERRGRPLIRIRDLPSETPGVWTPEDHPKGYVVRAGDIVVGMDGEFRAYLWGGDDAWLNQRVCVFRPKAGFSAAFVRNSIIDLLAHVEATEIATTVIHLGKNDIDRFQVVLATRDLISKFGSVCQPLYDRIVTNKIESRALAAMRDLLLPKLMSGEIRIKDVENIIGGAS